MLFRSTSMNAFADLEASGGGDCSRGPSRRQLGEIKDAQFLLETAGRNKIRVVGRVGNRTDNVIVLKRIEQLARVGVPNFAMQMSAVLCSVRENTHAVKSADAVAALQVSGLSLACQTAPL